jgi:hypothetical protein
MKASDRRPTPGRRAGGGARRPATRQAESPAPPALHRPEQLRHAVPTDQVVGVQRLDGAPEAPPRAARGGDRRVEGGVRRGGLGPPPRRRTDREQNAPDRRRLPPSARARARPRGCPSPRRERAPAPTR